MLPALLMLLMMGQAADAAKLPAGWHVRADGAAAHGTVSFVDMPPGWHITTGPSVILYDPARTARRAAPSLRTRVTRTWHCA